MVIDDSENLGKVWAQTLVSRIKDLSLFRLAVVRGIPRSEVAELEAYTGVVFPTFYAAYLEQAGRAAGKLFSRGEGVYLCKQQWVDRREGLVCLLRDCAFGDRTRLALPVYSHQGYIFDFVLAEGCADPPVFGCDESDYEVRMRFSKLSEYFEFLLHRAAREDRWV